MPEMLSPGVYVQEIDASAVTPITSNSIGVFAGDFLKGPVGTYQFVNNVEELKTNYGLPTSKNYNEWYQAYNFLQYSNKLMVSRAAPIGTAPVDSGETVTTGLTQAVSVGSHDRTIDISSVTPFTVGDHIRFSSSTPIYTITVIDTLNNIITLDRFLDADVITADIIYIVTDSMNAMAEAVDSNGVVITNPADYFPVAEVVPNPDYFELNSSTFGFVNADSKLKFIAKNPGAWGNEIKIAIAQDTDFGTSANAFPNVPLDGLFEYYPDPGQEFALAIQLGDTIETYVVSFDPNAVDNSGHSIYVETLVNRTSDLVYVLENPSSVDPVQSYLDSGTGTLDLAIGSDNAVTSGDITTAYDVWANKEEVYIDIVIGNEADQGLAAANLAIDREDCIAFIGAEYIDTVGQDSNSIVNNLVTWRKTGGMNLNSSYVTIVGNYKYQYDRYNDVRRWMNLAGDVAGLRSQTNTDRASWWASAGLERGQIKNVLKLAYIPKKAERDMLYKNAINPVTTFPGQGTVLWGQKTLLSKPSSFDRVNVRGLFNTVERALAKMSKYQVMEFNDNFTRNRITSMIKPYLQSVQAGRGIQDYLVVCDESNNTPFVISHNQLVVDIYIKPTYVAEMILLRFTNVGTNDFSTVIQ